MVVVVRYLLLYFLLVSFPFCDDLGRIGREQIDFWGTLNVVYSTSRWGGLKVDILYTYNSSNIRTRTVTSISSTRKLYVVNVTPIYECIWLDVPAGVTQEEGHTGFFIHLPSAVCMYVWSSHIAEYGSTG